MHTHYGYIIIDIHSKYSICNVINNSESKDTKLAHIDTQTYSSLL